jgi:hypothetical protein
MFQVGNGSFQRRHRVPEMPEHVPVTRVAQQTPDPTGLVVMVHGQASALAGSPLADETLAALVPEEGLVLGGCDPVRLPDPFGVLLLR